MLGVGASKKTYLDDVFSTTLYRGNMTDRNINTGIDMSGKGGLAWLYTRSSAYGGWLFDTTRGYNKFLRSSDANAEGTETTMISGFTNTGFSLDGDGGQSDNTNNNNTDYASWNFAKAPGFFDVVTYTGDGVAGRTVSHNLGCVPGCIMIKRLNASTSWKVYHRSTGAEKALALDLTDSAVDNDNYWNDTEPTASVFTLKQNSHLNATSGEYVAYVFAGGESTAATARSVELDGTGDYLSIASSSDFAFGTGDFTWEGWFKLEDDGSYLINFGSDVGNLSFYTYGSATRRLRYYNNSTGHQEIADVVLDKSQWYHFAVARSSNTTKVFINGIEKKSFTDNKDYGSEACYLGASSAGGSDLAAKMSNVRIVKGTAVYTSSFRPPTEPLTNITNTKLLCCNDSSTTGSTVTPGTITANGNPTASSDSPFDDPGNFVFGEAGDQNVIKCGSYVGNGSSTAGPEINLGFEPQWLMIKNTGASEHWSIFDSMRGLVTGGNDEHIKASSTDSEYSSHDWMSLTPTGFKINTTAGEVNQDGKTHIFIAIRRNDGYVGKPRTATELFAMDTGGSSSTIPNFDSGFPVDFAAYREPAANSSWYNSSRLTAGYELIFNTNAVQGNWDKLVFDSNVGWQNNSGHGSSYQSWMWKRHAGFDVVAYKGNGVAGRQIPHSMNNTVQMIWIKNRDSGAESDRWVVGADGLNGGTNPWTKFLALNEAWAEDDHPMFNDTAPTSTAFTVGNHTGVNDNNENYLAMLFSSVSGISKVGYYTGNGSTGQTITTGFQPRFLIIKNTGSSNWFVLDTLRGWDAGNDKYLVINGSSAQETDKQFGAPTSTGFTLQGGNSYHNASGTNYIYYAHA